MSLEEQIKVLKQIIDELKQEVEQLRAENQKLKQDNESLKQENEALKQQLATSSKPEPPSFVKANKGKKPEKKRKKREATDNAGRRRVEPNRIEIHQLETCPVCGEKLSEGSCAYRREVIDIPAPQPVEVVEHQIMKGWCWQCRAWQKPAINWNGVVMGSGRIGVRLVGLVVYLRAILRQPIRIIQSYLESLHQVRLSVGEISELCQRATNTLSQSVEALKVEARGSPVVHMDETGWRENGQNGYIWCLVTQEPKPIRCFEYHQSRSGDIPLGLLGDFSGHLISDFYAGYNKYTGFHQRCWVHLLRDLHDLRESASQNGVVVAWALGVKWLYQEAVRQMSHGLSAESRQTLYDRLWRMTEQFGLLYATIYKHPCCALAKRLLRHQDELFQFVLHPNLPADNNLAERALRPLVVQRKISGGSRSSSGSNTRMQLASLFETWKARQLNPLWECWRQLGYIHQLSLP